jgi:predicted metal-dependent phosphoesterase TrpH
MLDLHCHSTASDGVLTPTRVVERAHELGITALALTDHDTLGGLAEARLAGDRLGIEILTGVEISSTNQGGGSLHILGYLFDETDPSLAERLSALNEGRDGRNKKLAAKLTELGFPIAIEEVAARAKGTVGRPHFAAVMIDKGYVRTYEEAFDRFLAEGRRAFIDKEILSPREAIDALHGAKGLAVLAHPLAYAQDPARVEALVASLAGLGIDGIEVDYAAYTTGERSMLRCFAERYRLLALGGSDFHRDPCPAPARLPPGTLDAMRERRQRLEAPALRTA